MMDLIIGLYGFLKGLWNYLFQEPYLHRQGDYNLLVLLGIAFSFNVGVAMVRRMRQRIYAAIKSGVNDVVEKSKNTPSLANPELIERVQNGDYKIAAREFLTEKDRNLCQLPNELEQSELVLRVLMIASAVLSVVCMITPYHARVVALLLIPYPSYFVMWNVMGRCRVRSFKRKYEKVEKLYQSLGDDDKKTLVKGFRISAKKLPKVGVEACVDPAIAPRRAEAIPEKMPSESKCKTSRKSR